MQEEGWGQMLSLDTELVDYSMDMVLIVINPVIIFIVAKRTQTDSIYWNSHIRKWKSGIFQGDIQKSGLIV